MANFDRDAAWNGRTLAWLHYRQNFTKLNSQYWGGLRSEVWSRRFLAQNAPTSDFRTALGVSSPNWPRLSLSLGLEFVHLLDVKESEERVYEYCNVGTCRLSADA
jgi:hypothetical protein